MTGKLVKRALAETSVEASPAEVSGTIKEIFAIIGISFVRENIIEKLRRIEIYGKRRMTFRSWGDEIKIEIFEDNHGGSIVRAESKTRFSIQIYDYGKNKENLERIFTILTNRHKNTSTTVIK